MVKLRTHALREEPRYQKTSVVPLQHEESIIEWLQNTGRLISRGTDEFYYQDEEEAEELAEVIGTNDLYDLDADEEVEDLELD
ncbi:MAG: DUF3134 domain-containing protein [Goleter apudmare HA4340-LM2]|jgi:hypothetical protein|nr:DUF3134 domain-containing protein [Goleter apudmare HA4340-LM2]